MRSQLQKLSRHLPCSLALQICCLFSHLIHSPPSRLKYIQVHGSLEELHLDIPWKNLRSKPVIVKITGLYMVVCPNNEHSKSAEQQQEKTLANKRAAIAQLDATSPAHSDDEHPESFSSRLVTKIVDNIQLEVSKVHIRYEDRVVHMEAPFSFGLLVSRLAAESTNTNWKPSFVENQKVLFKLCTLEGLSFYANSDQFPSRTDSPHQQRGGSGFGGGHISMLRDNLDRKLAKMVEWFARSSEDDDDDEGAAANSDENEDADDERSAGGWGLRLRRPTFVLWPINALLFLKLNKSAVLDAAQVCRV